MKTSREDFSGLLERYGHQADNWPEARRQAALQYLASDPGATSLLEQHRALANLLDSIPVPAFDGLEQRLLQQELPRRKLDILDRLFNWLLPREHLAQQFWRTLLACCLPLAFGIVLGNYFTFGIETELNNWDTELTLLALDDYTETQP